jgi:hypothetical protein
VSFGSKERVFLFLLLQTENLLCKKLLLFQKNVFEKMFLISKTHFKLMNSKLESGYRSKAFRQVFELSFSPNPYATSVKIA